MATGIQQLLWPGSADGSAAWHPTPVEETSDEMAEAEAEVEGAGGVWSQ